MLVVPGVHRFKANLADLPGGHVNLYLLEGPGGSILVDAGWNSPGIFEDLEEQFAVDGVRIEDIRQIAVTHGHPDHFGLAGKFRCVSGARIAIHEADQALILSMSRDADSIIDRITIMLSENGVPGGEPSDLRKASSFMKRNLVAVEVDSQVKEGDILSNGRFELRALWSPGHSAGHICLYEQQHGLLFSGDHVLPEITPNIGLGPLSGPNPLDDFRNSLTRLRGLDIKLVLPGHGEPFENLEIRVDQTLYHHVERDEEALAALGSKQMTAYQIATMLTWAKDLGGKRYNELKFMDKRMAMMEMLAHLASLAKRGEVCRRNNGGGVVTYLRSR